MHPTVTQAPAENNFSAALQPMLFACASLAICGPAWLARNYPPSATFFNQAAALAGWAALALLTFWQLRPAAPRLRGQLMVALLVPALLAVATGVSYQFERLPAALALSALALLAAATLALLAGAVASQDERGQAVFQAVCATTLLAGVASVALALIQVFAPGWADGDWIARSSAPGRAGGNLRQPNHLSSLLLWAMAALLWLHETRVELQALALRKQIRVFTALLLALLLFGDVLTVSRTGSVCVLLLALWGVIDKRLSRFSRVLLWLAPLFYVLCWLGMNEWAHSSFAGGTQLQKSDLSSSRFGIWANTFALIKRNPLFGVGWGEFNFAWSLTPFPGRPVAFFDHTHNLPLQFLVELGIPLGSLVLALLAWVLWKAFVACRAAAPSDSLTLRTAFIMVLMMVVHSMLEYPLWYAYFLLPTAFALGICLGGGKPAAANAKPLSADSCAWLRRALMAASVALMVGTGASVADYMRVVAIFVPPEDALPLSTRIAEGERSWFFAHHADYAEATIAEHPSQVMGAFGRASHYLLDTRLMLAWARAFNESGDVERARYVADRLREFRNPDAESFFAECNKPGKPHEALPFQCTPSTKHFTYEDFRQR